MAEAHKGVREGYVNGVEIISALLRVDEWRVGPCDAALRLREVHAYSPSKAARRGAERLAKRLWEVFG